VGCQLLERSALHALPRRLERAGTRAPACERRQVDELLRRRAAGRDTERLARVSPLRLRRRRIGHERLGLGTERRYRALDARPLAELEHELAPGRAKRLVDAGEHPPKAVGPIGREQPEPLGIGVGAELLERALERLAA